MDKVVRVGRVLADRAHRTTAWGLIGLTVVCGVFATFAIGDMLIHNRRKRKEWLEEQQKKSAIALDEARAAAARGAADEDQILLLNRERVAAAAEAERKAQTGIFGKARNAMFGSSREASGESKIISEVKTAQERRGQTSTKVSQPSGFLDDVKADINDIATKTKDSAKRILDPAMGGPLDRQAAATVNAISHQSKGWLSWVSGR